MTPGVEGWPRARSSQGHVLSLFSVRSLLLAEAHWACETKYEIGEVEEKFPVSGA